MRILINTTNFDYAQVKAKMDLTYTHRQRLVQETKPIKEIVQLYPALAITDLVSCQKLKQFISERNIWLSYPLSWIITWEMNFIACFLSFSFSLFEKSIFIPILSVETLLKDYLRIWKIYFGFLIMIKKKTLFQVKASSNLHSQYLSRFRWTIFLRTWEYDHETFQAFKETFTLSCKWSPFVFIDAFCCSRKRSMHIRLYKFKCSTTSKIIQLSLNTILLLQLILKSKRSLFW